MPKIIIDDAKGLYQTSGKGVVGLTQSKTVNSSYVAASTKIQSGAVVIPANSLITAIHTTVTTTLASANAGAVTVKVGNAADGSQIANAVNLGANLAGAAAGRGNSTSAALTTALQGAATLVITAGQAYRSSETELHLTVTASGALTAGAVQFTVEFITFE
jgi:hypothetical protein